MKGIFYRKRKIEGKVKKREWENKKGRKDKNEKKEKQKKGWKEKTKLEKEEKKQHKQQQQSHLNNLKKKWWWNDDKENKLIMTPIDFKWTNRDNLIVIDWRIVSIFIWRLKIMKRRMNDEKMMKMQIYCKWREFDQQRNYQHFWFFSMKSGKYQIISFNNSKEMKWLMNEENWTRKTDSWWFDLISLKQNKIQWK